jgi:hypothetical protein
MMSKKLFQVIVIYCGLLSKRINPVTNPESTFYKSLYFSFRENKVIYKFEFSLLLESWANSKYSVIFPV